MVSDEGSRRPAVVVQGLSKTYALYRHPLDLVIEKLGPSGRSRHQEVLVLDDISFEVQRGECFAVVGPNGCGKSTLLRILYGTQQASSGRVEVEGSLSALLELGGTFQPDLPGRDNARYYGRICGVRRAEVPAYLERVEAFAELGDYFERPVRLYSSGMFVRLAFACAIELAPEVVLIDEALAVGDAYFQQKCVARLLDLRRQGRTVILVSHDNAMIARLCDRAALIYEGKLRDIGPAETVLEHYNRLRFHEYRARLSEERAGAAGELPGVAEDASVDELRARFAQRVAGRERYGTGDGEIVDMRLLDEEGRPTRCVDFDRPLTFAFTLWFARPVATPILGFVLRDHRGYDVYCTNTDQLDVPLPCPGAGSLVDVTFRVHLRLRPGTYSVTPGFSFGLGAFEFLDWIERAELFEILPTSPKPIYGAAHFDAEASVRVRST